MTRLDAQVATLPPISSSAISDLRGDGRPDYRYHAHVLYADTVSPSRISVNGGAVTVQGTGFAPGLLTSLWCDAPMPHSHQRQPNDPGRSVRIEMERRTLPSPIPSPAPLQS